jgi:hypothetical protein
VGSADFGFVSEVGAEGAAAEEEEEEDIDSLDCVDGDASDLSVTS